MCIRDSARTLPKTIAAAVATVAALLFLCLWPAKFEMVADGRIWPETRRDIFVQEDGMVREVLVDHGDMVTEGQELVRLHNPTIMQQITEIKGEWQAAIESAQSLVRQMPSLRNPVDRATAQGRLNEYKVRVKSYLQQIRQLEQRQANLTLRSPISGTVVTFRTEESLANRPLQRGEVVLTVVDPESDWELDLYMVETKMGHVRWYEPDGDVYDMRYILQSDPRNQREGSVAKSDIQNTAVLTEDNGNAIRLIGTVKNQEDLAEALPGTEVKAKVYCGRKPIGYKWFHQLVEWIQANLLF